MNQKHHGRTMIHAREVLNEIKWRDGLKFADVLVFYRDRHRHDLVILEGARILSWDKSFIYTDSDSVIPFHRVERIEHKNDVVLYKRTRKKE